MTGGKNLSSPALQTALNKIFDVYAQNAKKLCHVTNSQQSESFNCVITPKTQHYGGSESYDYHVGAAVCQKNVGYKYVPEVMGRLGLPPGKECESVMAREDAELRRRMDKRQQKTWKKRRLDLKHSRSSQQTASEVKEGTTYSTGVGFSAQDDIDLETVPSGKPKAELLPLNDTVDCSLVFFDVETKSLDFSTEITQIATPEKKILPVLIHGELSKCRHNSGRIPQKSFYSLFVHVKCSCHFFVNRLVHPKQKQTSSTK